MNHRITAATIMEAKTLYALKNYKAAAALCDSFLMNFPASDYAEDALFTRGMCYYNLGMYVKSAGEMVRVFTLAEQRKNQEHSLKMIEHLSLEFLTEPELDSISGAAEEGSVKELMQIILAERLFSSGKFAESKSVLNNITTDSADTRLMEEQLATLFHVSRVLSRSLELKETLEKVLQILHDFGGMRRGMVTLAEPDTGELRVYKIAGIKRVSVK